MKDLVKKAYNHFSKVKPSTDPEHPWDELLDFDADGVYFNIKESISLWDAAKVSKEHFEMEFLKRYEHNKEWQKH